MWENWSDLDTRTFLLRAKSEHTFTSLPSVWCHRAGHQPALYLMEVMLTISNSHAKRKIVKD